LEQKYETIGARLRQARTAKGLSIPDVFEKTSISRGNLSTLETDKSKPSSDALIALSELYGVTADWILKGDGIGPRFSIKEKDGVPYDSDSFPKVSNKELMSFFKSIAQEWETGDGETRGWIIVQMRKAFPDIAEKLKK
jgi:transcriptional regulator with XRE-family HTH domain